ncbi:MAG: hypothetical protein KDI63_01370 [Gammaproteobacteria bacterium]|nr:hypothetical protein [Gammaproteobacteria bacterium]
MPKTMDRCETKILANYRKQPRKQAVHKEKIKLLSHVVPVVMALACTATSAEATWSKHQHREIPFSVAELYLELNHTDGDLGIHSRIDGEPWKWLSITTPRERRMLDIRVHGRLKKQGLTELFFESAEPGFDELEPEAFLRRFPEGIYEVEGKALNGIELESETELSHVLPAPAGNIRVAGTPLPEDCDEDPIPEIPVPDVDHPWVVSWDPVTESHPEIGKPGTIEVVKYELYIERESPEPIKLFMDLPPDVTVMTVPFANGAIGPGEEFKVEVLVRESSGNQTAVESCFSTTN